MLDSWLWSCWNNFHQWTQFLIYFLEHFWSFIGLKEKVRCLYRVERRLWFLVASSLCTLSCYFDRIYIIDFLLNLSLDSFTKLMLPSILMSCQPLIRVYSNRKLRLAFHGSIWIQVASNLRLWFCRFSLMG